MVQRHTIDAIRERADLVEVVSQVVTLKRKGTSHLGLCPFHQEKSPSFNVVPHKGIFHCFGCGEGGDVFRFVMKTRGISFMDAVKELGQTYGIAVEERPLSPDEQRRQQKVAGLHDVVEIAAQYFHSVLQTRWVLRRTPGTRCSITCTARACRLISRWRRAWRRRASAETASTPGSAAG